MGACVTPGKSSLRQQKIPLPIQNTANSQINALHESSRIGPDIRTTQPINIADQNQFTLGTQRPSSSYLVNNRPLNQQVNQPQMVPQPQPQRNTMEWRPISEEPPLARQPSVGMSPRNTAMTNVETININPNTFPPIIRKQSTTQIRQQVQPQSIANSVQAMVDTYNVPRVQTPIFRGSAVNRLQQVVSYESKQLPFHPPYPANQPPSTVPVIHSKINPTLPKPFDNRLLSFDKNSFKPQAMTPIPPSFRYNISLPAQTNIF